MRWDATQSTDAPSTDETRRCRGRNFRFVAFLAHLTFGRIEKILVIDGNSGFIGGVGIADDWKGNGRIHGLWRDSHYEVRGL